MRMPHYGEASNKNDWTVTFFCEECAKPITCNSQQVVAAAKRDNLRRMASKLPLVGSMFRREEDESAELAWEELKPQFHECDRCNRVVGAECWDEDHSVCRECSGLKHREEREGAIAAGRHDKRR